MSTSSILFLAPGIRPGSGGVADYCVNLSAALTRAGVDCHLASWNEEAEGDSRERVLYLHGKSGATLAVKAAALRAYLEQHDIRWVSLQFVNFGFAKRGLIHGLAAALRDAFEGRRCHVFLHELWLGAHRGARLRDKVLGRLQKSQILHLLETLRPEEVWTNIRLYQRQLAAEGVTADTLPIFGNIPFSQTRMDDSLLRRLAPGAPEQTRDGYLFVGLFGTINRDWPFRSVLPRLLRFAGKRRVAFILFGRNGDAHPFCEYVEALPNAEWLALGPLEVEAIDHLMNSMDLALVSTPAEGIFKSGSAIAFLEHGVPTIAVHHGLDSSSPAESPHPSLILADDDLEKNLAAAQTARHAHPLLPEVAQRYLELLRA